MENTIKVYEENGVMTSVIKCYSDEKFEEAIEASSALINCGYVRIDDGEKMTFYSQAHKIVIKRVR